MRGATGDPVVLGERNEASNETQVVNSGSGSALHGTHASSGVGVSGASFGTGVRGVGINTGVGVEARSTLGFGLRVSKGRIRVDEVSGVATIRKGKKTVVVNPGVDVNVKTFVLLTPMSNIGSRALWFTKMPASNKFVIRISSKRTGPTKVAWLALERG